MAANPLDQGSERTDEEAAHLILETPTDQQWWCKDDRDGGPATAQQVARAYLALKAQQKTKTRKKKR